MTDNCAGKLVKGLEMHPDNQKKYRCVWQEIVLEFQRQHEPYFFLWLAGENKDINNDNHARTIKTISILNRSVFVQNLEYSSDTPVMEYQ